MKWQYLQRAVTDVIRTGDDVRRGVGTEVGRQLDRVASRVIPVVVEAVVSRIDLTDLVERHVDINELVARRVDILLALSTHFASVGELPSSVRDSDIPPLDGSLREGVEYWARATDALVDEASKAA